MPQLTGIVTIDEIDRITECLREAEQVIKPGEQTFYILHGLPPSWPEWRELQASIIKPAKLDALATAIKPQEPSLNRDQGVSNDILLAVQSKRLPCKRGYKGGKKPGRNRPSRQNRISTDETLTCYYCQKTGNKRIDCRKLKSNLEKGIQENQSGPPVQTVASVTDTVSRSVFTEFSTTNTSFRPGQWLLDSGCHTHVTGVKKYFTSYTPIPPGHWRIRVTDNTEIDALGEGEVALTVWDQKGKPEKVLVIAGVLHVPESGRNNLLSVWLLCTSSYYVEFYRSGGAPLRRDDGLVVQLEAVDGLYLLQTLATPMCGSVLALQKNGDDAGKEGAKRAAL